MTLHLQPNLEETRPERRVVWAEDTIDNEFQNKLKSNSKLNFLLYCFFLDLFLSFYYFFFYSSLFYLVCCIYNKKHDTDSESDKTCTSDDDTNAIERSR